LPSPPQGTKADGPNAPLRYAVERATSVNIITQGDPALFNLSAWRGLEDFSSDLCRIHRVANVLGVSAVDNTRRAPTAARVAGVGLALQAQEMTP
jgi:hypothetical protein